MDSTKITTEHVVTPAVETLVPGRDHYGHIVNFTNSLLYLPWRWCSSLKRSPRMRKVGCSNLDRDRPKLLKQLNDSSIELANAPQLV